MREDGGLIGYGMATAGCDVPALERSQAALPAALGPVMPASQRVLIVPEVISAASRPLPGRAAARGADPLNQEGAPVQVPVTAEPPTGRPAGCVVSP